MARSAHAFVRGNTVKFYEWLSSADAGKVPEGPPVENEFYDLDLVNAADGSLTLLLYDHQSGADVPIIAPAPVVPVSVWFQIEAFYRNAQDESGRLTIWLDGRMVVDVTGQPMAPTPWVEWDAVNVGENLTPSTEVVAIDDYAISLSRVGPMTPPLPVVPPLPVAVGPAGRPGRGAPVVAGPASNRNRFTPPPRIDEPFDFRLF